MAISKKKREEVKIKYGGLCAYSGTPLEDDWQVDHLISKRQFEHKMRCGCMNLNDLKERMKAVDNIENLIPSQKIINHYKRCLSLEEFREWYLGGLHLRLRKLPKNPKVKKSIKRKEYLLKVASYFNITEDKPFCGEFYFEKKKENI